MKAAAMERIAALADPAITRIAYLIEYGENEAVQLSAAKDALDRAGFKPVDESKVNHSGGVVINLPQRKAAD